MEIKINLNFNLLREKFFKLSENKIVMKIMVDWHSAGVLEKRLTRAGVLEKRLESLIAFI